MGDAGDAGDARWGEMPQDLVERIMERLPIDCCARFRTVCKRWNEIMSSEYFLAVTKQQFLFLCMPSTQMRCLVYSFLARAWQMISLSFIRDSCYLNYKGSAAGMLLVDIPTRNFSSCNVPGKTCVCNPVSRRCVWLPETSVKHVMAKGILPADDSQSYKVVVLGETITGSLTSEIYDSCAKSWTIASTHLPDDLVIRDGHMLPCNGCLYCLTANGGIFSYDIQKGTSAILPMPMADVTANNNKTMWPRLATCAGSVLVAAALEENYILQDVVIWEFQKKNGKIEVDCCWKEIGRMPKTLCEDFKRNSSTTWFECVGVGEYVCFRAHESLKVLAYSLSQRSWNWLPRCPDMHTCCKYVHLRSLALECMPDMKP